MADLVPTIGLEVHCQLKTVSKMFCACPVIDSARPNQAVCPVCLAYPGALPVLNDHAVRLAVRAGLALGCEVHRWSSLDRKHYFYPDLPKGYQITQAEQPICTGGALHCDVAGVRKRFGLAQIHLEEDAGKLTHVADRSQVDWNRSGVPLIEVVSEPDIQSADEAEAWLRMLHRVLVEADVTHGSLQSGHLRCDANVSLGPRGGPRGVRVELKNLNSFRFLSKAIKGEIARQRALLESGGVVQPVTRRWTGTETTELRSKERQEDYRYCPEHDLGWIFVDEAEVAEARSFLSGEPLDLLLLDDDAAELLALQQTHGLSAKDATAIVQIEHGRSFLEASIRAGGVPTQVVNWMLGPMAQWRNENPDRRPAIGPSQVVELESAIEGMQLTRGGARRVMVRLCEQETEVSSVVRALGLERIRDPDEILACVAGVLRQWPAEWGRLVGGEARLWGFFVGRVIAASGDRMDPQDVRSSLQVLIDQGATRV